MNYTREAPQSTPQQRPGATEALALAFGTLARPLQELDVILSDRSIRAALASGRIAIDPLDDAAVQPSSLDVRIGSTFRVFANHRHLAIDPLQVQPDLTDVVAKGDDEPFVLHPGEFVLGSTLERITLPDDLVARLEGKSSLARLGLVVHSTAGFIDAGFDGEVTLELSNVATLPILLHPGMRVAQLAFFQLDGPAENPYGSSKVGSKYQGQRGPTASRYHLNLVPPGDDAS